MIWKLPIPSGPVTGDTAKYNFAATLNGVEHYTLYHYTSIQVSFTGVSKEVLAGWQLGGSFSGHTGSPFTVGRATPGAVSSGNVQCVQPRELSKGEDNY